MAGGQHSRKSFDVLANNSFPELQRLAKDALEMFSTAKPPSNNTSSETAAVRLQRASAYTARDNKNLNPHIKLSGDSLSLLD